jgi:lactate dehydrogenase-like 2-hydroxyacid dehydrogenase
VTAIVETGPSGVDADLMKALPNLGAVVLAHDGYDSVDMDARADWVLESAIHRVCSTTRSPTPQSA